MSYDILTPLLLIGAPFFAISFLIETFIFWMFTGKSGVSFGKSLLVTFVANVTTALMMFFISFWSNTEINLVWYLIAYGVAVLIEWLVFIPFFYTKDTHGFKLWLISLVANTVTYTLIGFLLFYKNGLLDKYLQMLGM